jgi:hypothetical protein
MSVGEGEGATAATTPVSNVMAPVLDVTVPVPGVTVPGLSGENTTSSVAEFVRACLAADEGVADDLVFGGGVDGESGGGYCESDSEDACWWLLGQDVAVVPAIGCVEEEKGCEPLDRDRGEDRGERGGEREGEGEGDAGGEGEGQGEGGEWNVLVRRAGKRIRNDGGGGGSDAGGARARGHAGDVTVGDGDRQGEGDGEESTSSSLGRRRRRRVGGRGGVDGGMSCDDFADRVAEGCNREEHEVCDKRDRGWGGGGGTDGGGQGVGGQVLVDYEGIGGVVVVEKGGEVYRKNRRLWRAAAAHILKSTPQSDFIWEMC